MPSGPPSQRLPEPWTFFVDRSLGGRVVADALRVAGEAVEVHDDHFARDAPDQLWLAEVGAKYRLAVARPDGPSDLVQVGGYAAALKSAGRRTAPGFRFARVATSTRYAMGSMPAALADSTRLYMVAATTVPRADLDPK